MREKFRSNRYEKCNTALWNLNYILTTAKQKVEVTDRGGANSGQRVTQDIEVGEIITVNVWAICVLQPRPTDRVLRDLAHFVSAGEPSVSQLSCNVM